MFDEGTYVFARDVGDGFEEGVSGQKHLTPHLTLVLLGRGCAGQAQELVENLQSTENSREVNSNQFGQLQKQKMEKEMLVNLQHELHADPVLYEPHHQVGLTLEHPVVLPGQRVRVSDGEVEVGSWTGEKNVEVSESHNYDPETCCVRFN